MFVKKKLKLIAGICLSLLPFFASIAKTTAKPYEESPSLMHDSLARELGWESCTTTECDSGDCGGYFYDLPFKYPESVLKTKNVEITSNEGLYAQRGTSILEEKVTVTRMGQQLTGNKAYLYRDPITGKLSAIEMIGDVHLREPNTLILAKKGRYNFQTKSKTLLDVYYRTTFIGTTRQIAGSQIPFNSTQKKRKITDLTAWGSSKEIISNAPRRYEFMQATYSTCPPTSPAWQVRASHIVLDKNTGRGYATNARLLVKNWPVFYTPYINFPIDKRRQTGFLWPTMGTSNKWGPYVTTPFYWNIAPNYDMTITPGMLAKRGVQLSDTFRYLTESTSGNFFVSALPNDRAFADLRRNAESNPTSITPASGNTPAQTQAELNRIINSSTTRSAIFWRNDTRFNDNWTSHVIFNYASDDYYLHDFGNTVSDITQNQLLQEALLQYKGPHWDFTGRFQSYQTLHPVEDPPVTNPYRRFPQLILNADYPDQLFGLEYFLTTEATNFTILKNPGSDIDLPVGKRANLQPGISLPIYRPGFYINPRLQVAITNYYMIQVADTNTPSVKTRTVPIFDVASGLTFTRDVTLFKNLFQQTLEPQIYYVYIPYRNQSSIPTFDTTVNTLTYDQLFNYNRFSGIDRIGDANQIGVGFTTRFIDENSGTEISKLSIGQILYFQRRRVTLCNDNSCSDNPDNPSNKWRVSPLSATFNLKIAPHWSMDANSIWSTTSKQLANASINLHYQKDDRRVINFGYGFVHDGDVFSGNVTSNPQNNIKTTDISAAWPLTHDISAVGRWTQDWRVDHFQNLLFGLQYDTCCWAVRAVGGRAFVNLVNNSPQYNSQFYIQFALKGLGNIGTGNPTGLLSSITGYNTQFGQEL